MPSPEVARHWYQVEGSYPSRVDPEIKREKHVDADRNYLSPAGFIQRFSIHEISGWEPHIQEIVSHLADQELWPGSRPDWTRHTYRNNDEVIMDRLHLREGDNPLRGVLSAFQVMEEARDNITTYFVYVFETRLEIPPTNHTEWPDWHREIRSTMEVMELRLHPECSLVTPVFWVPSQAPDSAAAKTFLGRVSRFAAKFPLGYSPEAGYDSIERNPAPGVPTISDKAGPNPRAPGGWKGYTRRG